MTKEIPKGFTSFSEERRIRSILTGKTTSELYCKLNDLLSIRADSPMIPIIQEILRDRRAAEKQSPTR